MRTVDGTQLFRDAIEKIQALEKERDELRAEVERLKKEVEYLRDGIWDDVE